MSSQQPDSDYYSDSFCDTAGEEDTKSSATQQHMLVPASAQPPEVDDSSTADGRERSGELLAAKSDGGGDPQDDINAHQNGGQLSGTASRPSSSSSSATSSSHHEDHHSSSDASPSRSRERRDRFDTSSSWDASPQRPRTPPGDPNDDPDERRLSAGDNNVLQAPSTEVTSDLFNSTLPATRSNPHRAALAVAADGKRSRRAAPPKAANEFLDQTMGSTGGSRHRSKISSQPQQLSPSRHESNGKKLSKLQKYAVEEGIFAPLHAAIDDVRLGQLVTRLYDPEPLRQLTFRAVEERRDKITHEGYDSIKDAHLAPYWQRKVVYKHQLRNELLSKQQQQQLHHPTSLTPLPTQQGGIRPRHVNGGTQLPHLSVRPATCPVDAEEGHAANNQFATRAEKTLKPVDSINLSPEQTSVSHTTASTQDDASSGTELSPADRSSQRRSRQQRRRTSPTQRDTSSPHGTSRSHSSNSSAASSPEWVEQRPGVDPADAATAGGDPQSTSPMQQHLRSHSASRSHRTTGGAGSTRSSLIARVTTVKRKDLYALWMAARPPSPFQRLVSRLSYNPSQEFSLGWLVQKKSPPPGGTLRQVPERPPPRDEEHSAPARVRISSPRSAYVMLRQGIMVQDITPVSLQRFYLEGSLKGIPPKVAEFHFAAREKLRKGLLDEVLRAYDAICSTVSQEAFVEKLYAVNPEENRQALLSREEETICGGPKARSNASGSKAASRSSSAGALRMSQQLPGAGNSSITTDAAPDPTAEGDPVINPSGGPAKSDAASVGIDGSANEADDGAAAKRRIELTIQKQQRRQDKYMQQLARNAQLLRERATENKKREEVSQVKQERLLKKRDEVNRLRREEHARRELQLKEKRLEATRLEKDRQEKLLEKIKKGEEHASALAVKREQIRVLQHEERKILEETKLETVNRREKQHDYENLLLIDRIRRKAGRAQAMQEMRQDAMMRLKERRERNLIEMEQRTEEFADQLLAYERKHLTN